MKGRVVLKSGKDVSLLRRHPWIFSGAIKKMDANIANGDLVNVFDNKDNLLATGHYQAGTIAVRILSFDNTDTDQDFWNKRIANALEIRRTLCIAECKDTNVYRLVNAEGDSLPGLIIDYYNGHAVIQLHSVGMYKNLDSIVPALKKVYGKNLVGIFNKSESTLPFQTKTDKSNGYLLGNAEDTIVQENGLSFKVNWTKGQKTGFFIDQRENRKLLQEYSFGKDVLNMFCYTGGFSVYALKGGAKLVHSVDSSAEAVELVNENIALNFKDSKHEAFEADAFKYLHDIKDRYDIIILDPPAFAKHQKVLHNALQGYKRLNQKALEQLKPGGILFTFSCSQAVSKENFRKSVFAASANAKRNIRILNQLSQPSDHPVSIYHPEGEYLKGLVLYVE
ncbi:MAG: class I SAM-dependent rRNA methyltransferase [Bacteroidales bacterium]|nr:class I SAM-dependent rRNA methyltransferase [Bacteroidales bacterium]